MKSNNISPISRSSIKVPLSTKLILDPTIYGAKWGSHSEVFIPLYVPFYSIIVYSPFGKFNYRVKLLNSPTLTYPLLITLDNFQTPLHPHYNPARLFVGEQNGATVPLANASGNP